MLALGSQVGVWIKTLEVTDARFEVLNSFLSDAEHVRARKYKTERLQRNFVVARGTLRELLGSCLNVAPRTVQFSYSSTGKPRLHESHGSSICFNLSHAGDKVAIAVSKGRDLGIDIELIDHSVVNEQLAEVVFTTAELQKYLALPLTLRAKGFFKAWTWKEALMKAVGSGLSLGFHSFEVNCNPLSSNSEVIPFSTNNTEVIEWKMFNLKLENNYAGAVAVQGGDSELLFATNPNGFRKTRCPDTSVQADSPRK